MPCFYSPHYFQIGKLITIEGDEFHHLAHVFRKQKEETILITNGKGQLASAKIIDIEKKRASLSILEIQNKQKSLPHIALAFSLLKQKNDELLVEKTTELGVYEFFPFTSARTIRKKTPSVSDRFQKTLLSASKQCDNAIFPTLHPVSNLPSLINNLQKNNYTSFVAYENEQNNYLVQKLNVLSKDKIALIIGPEGGFLPEEISFFKENQIPSVSLGNHILRAETAAISGISQIIFYLLEQNKDFY